MYPSQLGGLLLGKVLSCAALLWALPTESVLLPGKESGAVSHFLTCLGTPTHIRSRCVAFSKGGMVLK